VATACDVIRPQFGICASARCALDLSNKWNSGPFVRRVGRTDFHWSQIGWDARRRKVSRRYAVQWIIRFASRADPDT